MQDFVDILSFGFMQRALLGGVVVSLLTGLIGVYMVLQKASFFSDAIAHASLTGVAVGILVGIDPVISAAIYAVMIALVLPWIRKQSKLPVDSILGFVLPFSMAMGVILLSYVPGYRPELISFLFGNILSISVTELMIVVLMVVVMVMVVLINQNKLLMVAFDKVQARVAGLNVQRIETWFNILMAITIVTGVRLVGIVLINALLIIPATIVRLHARSLNQMMIMTPLLSAGLTIAGILMSIITDWPTGPTIALIGGVIFLSSLLFKSVMRK